MIDKINKRCNDDSNIMLNKVEEIKAVEEAPEFLEGQSCGYESDQSGSQITSESSSSFISNLSMMIGEGD